MSLLDGKYEVIGQRPLEGGRTLFDAIAPDGTPLRVEWFDLPSGQEAAFERYRRLLRTLKRDDLAAVHDVVSRPGARYVAWLKPEPGSAAASDSTIQDALTRHAFSADGADIRRAPRKGARLYGLAFDGLAAPPEPAEPLAEPVRPLRGGATRRVDAREVIGHLPQAALSWGLAGLLLIVAAGLALAAFRSRVVDQLIVVPDLLGSEVNAAVKTLGDMRLAVEVAPIASLEAAGSVLSVEPPAGSELRPGRLVRVGYALPAGQLAQTAAPALVGLTYPDEVGAALAAAGLELGEVSRIAAAAPAGVVLAQTVSAGERVGSGTHIAVLVSAGPAATLTFLPRLVGLDVESATELAEVAGIAPDRILIDSVAASSGAPGTVLSQSLAPYVTVPQGDAILRLVVQAGMPTTAMGGAPDLVGMSLEAAERTAAADGTWNLQVERIASLGLPAGVVVMQTPPPGGTAEDGALRLTLNVHPVTIGDPGISVVVRQPQARTVAYAWTILPGIGTTTGEVWATSLDGTRTLVARPTVSGGQILRGTWRTTDPGPVSFELLLGGIPYGDPLLVP